MSKVLWVNNLGKSTNWGVLEDLFQKFGPIQSNTVRSFRFQKGYAYIYFENQKDAVEDRENISK